MSNELHTMPLKVEKFFSSANVRLMRWDERGAYILLLAEAWLLGGYIPLSRDVIKGLLTGVNNDDYDRIENNVIKTMFRPSEDGKKLINDTLSEIYNETQKRIQILSESGKKGMAKRWGNKKVITSLLGGYNNQIQNQNQINKKENISKKKYGEWVFLKEGELERLEGKYGKELTGKAIRFLDDYLANNPKKRKQYSDHNRCIHNWVITAVKEKMAREKKADDIIGVQKSSSSMVSKFIPPPKDKPEEEGNLPI